MTGKGLLLDHLCVSLHGQSLFEVTTCVKPGEVLSIMGPSGSGKSTLINAIIGLLPSVFALTGRIELDGMSLIGLPVERRRVGVLFQDPLLFPHFSVGQNIAFGLPRSIKGKARDEAVARLLSAVELEGFAERDPFTLSGGQKARVALLRVLAAEPCALLLDEPFSKLDPALRQSVRDLVFAETRRRELPVLMVTHDRDDAAAAGGGVLHLGEAG
ncbi:MAG: ATP-binding cassette domain-containing protein [Hyphomicrobiaceae bacterium]|nr:ATP-binding cassette domain-containing protein [Hyphomicrobiaceae bacterium]